MSLSTRFKKKYLGLILLTSAEYLQHLMRLLFSLISPNERKDLKIHFLPSALVENELSVFSSPRAPRTVKKPGCTRM